MPARLEIAPPKSIRVATIGVQTMRINRPTPTRWSTHVALGAAACAIGLIAAFGAAWRGVATPPAPTSTQARVPATEAQAPVSALPAPAVVAAETPTAPAAVEAPTQRATPPSARPTAVRAVKTATAASKSGTVVFAVSPWGEVFVDGARHGTTPPLAQLTLPAGRHTIELRNGQRQPFIAQVEVEPDRSLRISHLFN
jgi:serine/threonine-protein kinase